MSKEIICIACPTGCHINIEKLNDDSWDISGNKCSRGRAYSIEELTEPKRTVTFVVNTNSKTLPYIPVKTNKPLLKNLIDDLLTELSQQKVTMPVNCGDVLIDNFKNSGVDVVFTRKGK